MLLIWLVFLAVSCQRTSGGFLSAVIISQDFPFEEEAAKILENDIKSSVHDREVKTFLTHRDFANVVGGWAVWPLLRKLEPLEHDFYLFLEPFTKIDDQKLIDFLKTKDPEDSSLFIGHGLVDVDPVIIHHFYGHDAAEKLVYPDFGAGVVLSKGLITKLLKSAANEHSLSAFTIDAKFELTKMVHEFASVALDSDPRFCLQKRPECLTWLEMPDFGHNTSHCGQGTTNENVFFAVKTFSGHHKTRILYVKRTWAKEAKYVEFYSDIEDTYVPTVNLGIPNTEKGHCTKTLAILKHALEHEELNDVSWLVLADDDTLLSVPRLYRMLNCLPKTKKIILGERYGFGFTFDGVGGYNYPTGGAGMVFSRPAARQIVAMCTCPGDDSPDDMILGMCARRFSIPVLHSSAFHQARPTDYAAEYMSRQPSISFHKFEGVDPYKVYTDLLHQVDPFLEQQKKEVWSAQHKKNNLSADSNQNKAHAEL